MMNCYQKAFHNSMGVARGDLAKAICGRSGSAQRVRGGRGPDHRRLRL